MTRLRPAAAGLRRGEPISENFVCVFERFFAPDIEPFAFDLKRFYRFARVEPLHKTARLVGIIAGRKIGS